MVGALWVRLLAMAVCQTKCKTKRFCHGADGGTATDFFGKSRGSTEVNLPKTLCVLQAPAALQAYFALSVNLVAVFLCCLCYTPDILYLLYANIISYSYRQPFTFSLFVPVSILRLIFHNYASSKVGVQSSSGTLAYPIS